MRHLGIFSSLCLTATTALAAPPVDGKANEALLAWLAEALGLRRRDLALVRGQTARRKWVEIDAPASSVIETVQRLLADSSLSR